MDRRLDAALRRRFAEALPEAHDAAQIRQVALLSRRAFRAHEARLPLRGWEFLLQQARYVRKRWWILQGAVLLALWLALRISPRAEAAQRFVGVLAPAFGMLALPELWKNRNCGATEVEGAARFGLRQVYAARLLLFGMVDLIWLSLFFAAASVGAKLEIGALILQFFVPLNVTGCICFATLRARRFGSEAAALLACGLWVALWVLVVLDQGIYARVGPAAWCALLAASALWLLRCAAKLCGENGQSWEEDAHWN